MNYYNKLGLLRNYIESGIVLASVNFWRDSLQGYNELEIIENRQNFVSKNEAYLQNEFIKSFFSENFPETSEKIEISEVADILELIKKSENEETYDLFKDCLLNYTIEIAKASKEDWLSFVGINDNISDNEATFLNNLKILFNRI